MDKRLMKSSESTDKLWYVYRTDTDFAELVAAEYVGTAGWHPETSVGEAAAVKRAAYKYPTIPTDALVVNREQPTQLNRNPDTQKD